MTKVSRIRWLRRRLLKIAMWGDPEALYPDDMQQSRDTMQSAKDGCIEDQIRLERGFYARRYLLGERP